MKILWFTWKDAKNPSAGGAEAVNEELAKRLVRAGHEVTFVVAGFTGAAAEEARDGFQIFRVGGRWSVYWRARQLYRGKLTGWADLVIDEINTVPFFCKLYVREKNLLFVHQLARDIWFYELFLPLAVIGYILEPFYLSLLSDRRVVTISESTKRDLMRYGFKSEAISVIPQGTDLPPVVDLAEAKKPARPTMLVFGSVRPMKRTLHALRAFEIAKKDVPLLSLVVAGPLSGPYGKGLLGAIRQSPFAADIRYLGTVAEADKAAVLGAAHVLCVTSVKEGWGLVVTEAARRGTPAVVYDVDGLRDSVRHGDTGLVISANPEALAAGVVNLLKDEATYGRLRTSAWEWSKVFDFDRSAEEFLKVINGL